MYRNIPIKGFTLQTTRIINLDDIIILTKLLSTELKMFYNNERIEIEHYSDHFGIGSGLVFNNIVAGYKGMTLYKYFENLNVSPVIRKYGRLIDINMENFVCNENEIIYTLLKNYNNDLCWSIDELTIFEKCFNAVGIIVISDCPKI